MIDIKAVNNIDCFVLEASDASALAYLMMREKGLCDVPPLKHIETDFRFGNYHDQASRFLQNPYMTFFGLAHQDRFFGKASVDSKGVFENLFIDPDFAGHHYSDILHTLAKEHLLSSGQKTTLMHVWANNDASIKSAHRNGFKIIDRVPTVTQEILTFARDL